MIENNLQNGMRRNGCYGAIFVDHDEFLESVGVMGGSMQDAADSLVEFCRLLPLYLERNEGIRTVVRHLYADVNGVEQDMLMSLNLLGYEVRYGLKSDKIKRMALELCIDVQETIHRRSEIEAFVLVLGCRDYLPIVRHIQKNVREVMIACGRNLLSGDLLLNVGSGGFLDIDNVMDVQSEAE